MRIFHGGWICMMGMDAALIVCTFCLVFPSKSLMPFLRTFSPSLKITCYHGFQDMDSMALSQLLLTTSATLEIMYNHIYRHKTMWVNYTTYDMWCEQDTINPCMWPDIMVLSHEDEGESYHPYWYACMLSVFYVNIQRTGPQSTTPQIEKVYFLWVRWFGRDLMQSAG